jgi:hypothetical protein
MLPGAMNSKREKLSTCSHDEDKEDDDDDEE